MIAKVCAYDRNIYAGLSTPTGVKTGYTILGFIDLSTDDLTDNVTYNVDDNLFDSLSYIGQQRVVSQYPLFDSRTDIVNLLTDDDIEYLNKRNTTYEKRVEDIKDKMIEISSAFKKKFNEYKDEAMSNERMLKLAEKLSKYPDLRNAVSEKFTELLNDLNEKYTNVPKTTFETDPNTNTVKVVKTDKNGNVLSNIKKDYDNLCKKINKGKD